MTPLPDIQRTLDTREVPINRVGVTGVRLPIRVRRHPGYAADATTTLDDAPQTVDTVGEFELACSLKKEVKGTHMSRFTEVLQSHIDKGGIFSSMDLLSVAEELVVKMESDEVFVKVVLDYFMEQPSPITGRRGVAPLKGVLQVRAVRATNGHITFMTDTGVIVEGKTCCPCSREISDYDHVTGKGKGAHAQRSRIDVQVWHSPTALIWFESLVQCAWRAFSQPVYPVLKRPDERHITVNAYENPKFVEDVIRDMACQLRQMPGVRSFKLRVQNSESIHYHDAYAEIEE